MKGLLVFDSKAPFFVSTELLFFFFLVSKFLISEMKDIRSQFILKTLVEFDPDAFYEDQYQPHYPSGSNETIYPKILTDLLDTFHIFLRSTF